MIILLKFESGVQFPMAFREGSRYLSSMQVKCNIVNVYNKIEALDLLE